MFKLLADIIKAVFHKSIDDEILKDRPDGEILMEKLKVYSRFLGIKIYRKDYNFICSIKEPAKNTGFK